MPVATLDARTVDKLPVVPGRRVEYFDDSLPGFAVRVSPSGHRSYVLTYAAEDGSNRRVTIGRVERISLASARAKARALRAEVELGADPALDKRQDRAERQREAVASRFKDLCDTFVKDQSPDWRLSTRKGWIRYIEVEIKPALGDRVPLAVTPAQVRALIDKIKYGEADGKDQNGEPKWKRKPAPVSARRCFEVFRRICAWAVWKGYIEVSPCVAAKPFERKRSGKRAAGRSKPYSDEQLNAIYAASKGTELECLVDLVARTGVRVHEARAARWADIDEPHALWRVPAEMHKTGDETGRPHLVPLSAGALRLIKRIRELNLAAGDSASGWLFPAATGPCEVCGLPGHADKANKASACLKAAAGIADRGLLHRLRDTLKTRMSEHEVPERVSEHILGHVVPGIAGVYDHAEMLPQRREALAWWDQKLDRILKPKGGSHDRANRQAREPLPLGGRRTRSAREKPAMSTTRR
jgi:integrase